jgi:hypothetical protein
MKIAIASVRGSTKPSGSTRSCSWSCLRTPSTATG